ncbi:MAG: hypothetical protein JW915_09865, partial [Chitinispirillaceae bacterium]|nr:hypothetical protein [Chitinispirillaceae bacterium]
ILTVPLIFLLRKGPPCNYMGEAETPGFIPGASFLYQFQTLRNPFSARKLQPFNLTLSRQLFILLFIRKHFQAI